MILEDRLFLYFLFYTDLFFVFFLIFCQSEKYFYGITYF